MSAIISKTAVYTIHGPTLAPRISKMSIYTIVGGALEKSFDFDYSYDFARLFNFSNEIASQGSATLVTQWTPAGLSGPWRGYTIRLKLTQGLFGRSTDGVQLRFRSPSNGGLLIEDCYIGAAATSGDLYDFDGPPTPVTFDGGAKGFVISEPNTEIISDAVPFNYTPGNNLVISFYVPTSSASLPLWSRRVADIVSYGSLPSAGSGGAPGWTRTQKETPFESDAATIDASGYGGGGTIEAVGVTGIYFLDFAKTFSANYAIGGASAISADYTFDYSYALAQTYSFDYGVSLGVSYTFDYAHSVDADKSFDYAIQLGQNFTFDYRNIANIANLYGFDYAIQLGVSFDFDFNYTVEADYSFDYALQLAAPFAFDYAVDLGVSYSFDYRYVIVTDFSFDFKYATALVVSFDYAIGLGASYTFDYLYTTDADFTFDYGYELGVPFGFDYRVQVGVDFDFDYRLRFAIDYAFTYRIRPPTIFVDYSFSYLINTYALSSGFMLVPETPVAERWEYLTTSAVARDGSEQRAALRRNPRVSVDYNFVVTTEAERRVMFDLLYQKIRGAFLVPLYAYAVQISAPVAQGQTVVSYNAARTDIRAGDFLYYTTPDGETGAFEIAAIVGTNALTLAFGTGFALPAGSWIMPALEMTAAVGAGLSMSALGGSVAIAFDALDNRRPLPRPGSTATVQTFDGFPVVTQRHSADASITDQFDGGLISLDEAVDVRRALFSPQSSVFVGGARSYRVKRNSEALDYWRDLLDMTKGKRSPFLISTYRNDLEPGANVASDELNVIGREYLDKFESNAVKRLEIEAAGVVSWHKVTGVSTIAGGLRLTLDTPYANADIDRVSFLNLVRLNSDTINVTHEQLDTVINLSVRSVDA